MLNSPPGEEKRLEEERRNFLILLQQEAEEGDVASLLSTLSFISSLSESDLKSLFDSTFKSLYLFTVQELFKCPNCGSNLEPFDSIQQKGDFLTCNFCPWTQEDLRF